jgi:hypothetical protein
VIFYLAIAVVAVRISPGRGFEVAAAVLAAFAITGPLRVLFGRRLAIEAVSCLTSAALLYVAIAFTITTAGAALGEEGLALAIFVPALAGTLAASIAVRTLLAWRRQAAKARTQGHGDGP